MSGLVAASTGTCRRLLQLVMQRVEALACRTSSEHARAVGEALGAFVWHVLRLRRGVTLSNLQLAFPELPGGGRSLGAAVYRHLGRLIVEFLRLQQLDVQQAQRILGEKNLQRIRSVLAAGRGALVLSAHLGNWDLLACSAALCGLPVNVITRQIKAQWLNDYWMRTRAHFGVRLLPDRGSASAILGALRRNEVVVFVLDQHAPDGPPLPFLGRPAATSLSLARIARATGVPVLPVFLPRQGEAYVGWVGEPLTWPRTHDKTRDLLEYTAVYNAVIEQVVSQYPEQWFWVHRRWKVRFQP